MADSNNEILIKLKAIDEISPILLKATQAMEQQAAKMAGSVDRLHAPLQQTEKNTHGLSGGLVTLAAGLSVVTTVASAVFTAFGKVSDSLAHSVEEALIAEKVQNQLTGALVSTGNYTQELSDKIENYSQKLEENKGISAEQTKALVAQAVQMGVGIDQALKMEEAARKLAAATGQDATSAFNMLQSAMNGQSRGLAKVLPQVKELSEAQLKSGAAIDIVNKSLDAQYKLYSGSFGAGVTKAKNALSNVYEAVGNIIIQNPLVIKAIDMFTNYMVGLAESIQDFGKWIADNQSTIEAWASAGAKAFSFLYDSIVGGIKFAVSVVIEHFSTMMNLTSKVAGIFNKDLAASIDNVSARLKGQAESLGEAGVQQIEYAGTAQATAASVEEASKQEQKAIDATLAKQSQLNASAKEVQKTYGGFGLGTESMRLAMDAEVQERERNLKMFDTYMSNKMRIAVSREQEQMAAVAKVRSETLTSGGSSDSVAGAESEILAEQNKQTKLREARKQGLIDQQALDQEIIASEARIREQQLIADQAFTQARATALGQTPEALEMRKQMEEQNFQLDLQNKIARAEMEGATETQIQSMREQAELEHKGRMVSMNEAYWEQQAQANEAAGNDWDAMLARMRISQERHGVLIGTMKTVQNTQEYKGTLDLFNNLSSLRNVKSKSAFEAGKKAAIAEATVKTFMAATSAYASLAGIPLVGPALGAAAAAAAVTAGFVNIQQINSQQFQGGQADSGMDAIPQSLDGKSFTLSAGERVIQPTANKQLTEFLNSQKGSGSSNSTYNITLNYSGAASKEDARKMADMVIKEIRAASERGTPVISSKGVV